MIPALHLLPDVRGVIQIGANAGQEVPYFERFTRRLLLCEPLPALAAALTTQYPHATVVRCAVGTEEGVRDFHVASNNGESSSLHVPVDHVTAYPEITFLPPIPMDVVSLPSLFVRTGLDPADYNVLVTDTQGSDLDVLRSAGDLLSQWDLLVCEYINTPLYAQTCTVTDLTAYVAPFGFRLHETGNDYQGAGDVVFLHDRITRQ